MALGFAVSVTVGTGAGGFVTVTITELEAVVLPFVHCIEYEVVEVGVTTNEPVVDVAVVHGAEHVVAFVDDHESVDVAPS